MHKTQAPEKSSLLSSPQHQQDLDLSPLNSRFQRSALVYAILAGLSLYCSAAQAQINVLAGEAHTIPGTYSPGAHAGGSIAASGTLMISSSGWLDNTGTLDNLGALNNWGGWVTNKSTLNNAGSISSLASADISNQGIIVNLSADDPFNPGQKLHGRIESNIASSAGSVLRFAQDNDYTYSHVLSGDGSLEQTGTGSTTLTGTNTYTGGTLIKQGALIVNRDANLGAASSGITLDGGTLRIDNSPAYNATARSITLGQAGGTLQSHNAFRITQAISPAPGVTSDGGLTFTGNGYFVLEGENTYTGLTTIKNQAGVFIGNGNNQGSIAGDIRVETALRFNRGDQPYTHAGAISGPGFVSKNDAATLTLMGTNTFTGGLDIYRGKVIGTSTSLGADAILLMDGGTALEIDQALDGTMANRLSSFATGYGTLSKTNTGTLTLTGDGSYFSGRTDVLEGALLVGLNGVGSLGGAMDVHDGATLGGTGTVSSAGRITTLHDGATLAPGNSPGTLRVAGDLLFEPGSTFEVEASDTGVVDQVQVAGTATLAGHVQVLAQGANFAPRTDYTILTANDVQQTFDTVSANYTFLTPQLAYTDKEVTLTLVRKAQPAPPPGPTPEPPPGPGPAPTPEPMRFHDAAQTENQYATADGIESLPDTHPVYRHVETLPEGQAPQAFDALSGELHASTQAALLAMADTPRERLFSHLRRNLSVPAASAGSEHFSSTVQPLWADLTTRQQRLGNEADIAQARLNTTSLTLGGDTALGAHWRVGAAAHYTDGRLKLDDRRSRADLDSAGLTLGAGRAWPTAHGQLNALLSADYTWHRIQSRRDTGDSGLDQTLKARYEARTVQVAGELGYALPIGPHATLEPYAGLAWTRLHTDAFQESGASAALSGQSQSEHMTTSTLGLRTTVQWPLAGERAAWLRAGLGWRHAFNALRPHALLAFDGGQTYTVHGTPIAQDAALVDLGVEVDLSTNASLGLSYAGQFGNNGLRDHAGELRLRWAF